MASSGTLVLLTTFLLCSHLYTAADLVHQECMNAPKLVSSLNPDRCVALLSTDPKAAKATTLKELSILGLELGVASAGKALDQINAAVGDSKTSPGLKSVLKAVADQVKLVGSSFKSALAEVQEDDFLTANYDCFTVSDYIKRANDELKKSNEKVDVYQTSIDTLSDFGLINYVITNDADHKHNRLR